MKLFNIFCNNLILQKPSSYQKEINIGRSCYEFYLVLITKDCFKIVSIEILKQFRIYRPKTKLETQSIKRIPPIIKVIKL